VYVRLFLTGVACVGKTTIGRRAAELLAVPFFDLDHQVEAFFSSTISSLRREHLTEYSYRLAASKALVELLSRPESHDCVIALPPSGLMSGYLAVLKKSPRTVAVLHDKPENILERIVFYDDDSRRLEVELSDGERALYMREIKEDLTYFGRSYKRADLQIVITGLGVEEAARKVVEFAVR